MAWLAYLMGLARRSYHWLLLTALIAMILTLGLGMPITLLDSILGFWKHW